MARRDGLRARSRVALASRSELDVLVARRAGRRAAGAHGPDLSVVCPELGSPLTHGWSAVLDDECRVLFDRCDGQRLDACGRELVVEASGAP